LRDIGIKVEDNEGNTPDPVVNSWHRDLAELTAGKILALANVIFATGERKRFLSKRVLELLAEAMASQQIDRTRVRLNPESLAKIEGARPVFNRAGKSSVQYQLHAAMKPPERAGSAHKSFIFNDGAVKNWYCSRF
jgi:hypothetical protein